MPFVRGVEASSAVLPKNDAVTMVDVRVGDGGIQIYSRVCGVRYHEWNVEVKDGKDVTTGCLLQIWCLAKIVRNCEHC
jgi:hypothetical protein